MARKRCRTYQEHLEKLRELLSTHGSRLPESLKVDVRHESWDDDHGAMAPGCSRTPPKPRCA